mgnify:CR=1 FL=1
MSLSIAKFDRYDLVNNPKDKTASFTIWFSGCDMKCKNCQNPILWDKNKGHKYTAESVAKIVCATCNQLNLKSVVLLGGEPLQQDIQELLFICQQFREAGLKVWLYTGYEFDDIPKDLLPYLSTIKCGRYKDELKQEGFPASSNQKIYKRIMYTDRFADVTEFMRNDEFTSQLLVME